MDGVLLIDKPVGPTSHDVVARIRRAVRQRDIGHTGTLDPLASGLLPLVIGRATRIASLLTGADKTYEAAVTLGVSTDTNDRAGMVVDRHDGALPTREAITAALQQFRGALEQVPPEFSAKRVEGRRAYDLARRAEPVSLAPVVVNVRELELLAVDGPRFELRLTVSAGFYVRSLARDLGRALGCGAHLSSLRRTASGDFRVADAIGLDAAERLGTGLADRVLTPAAALSRLPAVRVTEAGLARAVHGNALGPEHLEPPLSPVPPGVDRIRVLAGDGHLVALAQPRAGSLHPVVVLG